MGLLKFILGLSEIMDENEKDKKKQKLEQEMEWNHLDNYEKEEVRKGNYDVYNFEDSIDENLDEDDYYSEDRK